MGWQTIDTQTDIRTIRIREGKKDDQTIKMTENDGQRDGQTDRRMKIRHRLLSRQID